MIGLAIEIGIRTSVWIITKGCQGVYYLCFGNSEKKKQRELEEKIFLLENRIKLLESE